MPTARHTQETLSAGEFDPLLYDREGVSFYYNSGKIIDNAVPLPQGGAKRREGFRFRQLQRGQVTFFGGSYTYTAPNGGNVSYIDNQTANDFETTTGIGTTAEYVIYQVNTLSAVEPSLLPVFDLAFVDLPGGVTQGNISWQHSDDDISYTTVATIAVGNIRQDRMFAVAPGNTMGSHQYWRLIVDNPGGATDFSTATVIFNRSIWSQEATYGGGAPVLGEHNIFRLTASITDEYLLWIVNNCIDVFRGDTGAWVASVFIPHTDAQIPDIKISANLDTLIIYHQDQPPYLVQRIAGDANWRSAEIEFDSIVEFPFDDATEVAGVNEEQLFDFENMTAGDLVAVEFNGQVSAAVTWNASEATNRSNLATEIEGLDDITSVTMTALGTGLNANFTVEFTDVDGEKSWALLIMDIQTGSGTVTSSRSAFGKPAADLLWSATRGYPKCGTFYQGRHWMGGFKARPDVLVGSRAGGIFDFKEDADPVVASPIVVAPNIDEQVTIQNIYAGRHLQIFTSSAEIYVPDEPITVDNIALKITSRHGSNDDVQPVDIQGGTLFVDRNGRALREYLFQDAEQSYSAEPISILAGHLMSSPRSMPLRRARDVDEPTLLLVANTGQDREGNDVPAAFVVVDRAQQVTGFCRITTNGDTVERFATTQAGDAFAVTLRSMGGTTATEWRFLEQFDDGYLSDASYEITNTQFDEFTATALQTLFAYTFTSPATDTDVAVWTRASVAADWARIADTEYTVDRAMQEVTFNTGLAVGTLVYINRRQDTVDTSGVPFTFLEGQTVEVHGDGGIPIGSNETVSGDSISLGDERWDFTVQVGLRMVPRIVLHPFRGRGEQSPTMQKQRIFRALFTMERTGALAIGMEGQTPKPVSLQNFDAGALDPTFEETLFSGAKRVSGIGKWELEPRLEITQNTPAAFLMKAIRYDVRF